MGLFGCNKNEEVTLEHVDAKEATCLENGNISYYVSTKDNKYYRDEAGKFEISYDDTIIAKTSHNLEYIEAKEATCYSDGNVSYYHCLKCNKNYDEDNKVLENISIKKLTHELSHIDGVNPSCVNEGVVSHDVCNLCRTCFDENGLVINNVNIPKIEHNLTFVDSTPNTCDNSGNISYYHCSSCKHNYDCNGVVIDDVSTPKLNHNLTVVNEKASTCEEYGNIKYYHCDLCNRNYDENQVLLTNVILPLAAHQLTHVDYQASTCAEYGNIAHEHCNVCDKNFDENGSIIDDILVEKTSHSLKKYNATPATCLKDGNVEYYHCSKCGYDYDKNRDRLASIIDPKLDHEMTHYEYNAATCLEDGNNEYYHCSLCNINYLDNLGLEKITSIVISKTGHNIETITSKEATCLEDGNIDAKHCTYCNTYYTLTDEVISESEVYITKVSHKFTNYVANNDADYLHDGTKTAYCDFNCGTFDTITDIATKKLLPLAGKTYYNVLFDSTNETNKEIPGYKWNSPITFSSDLTVTSFAFPFRGFYKFVPVTNNGDLDIYYYSWISIDSADVKGYQDQGVNVYQNSSTYYIVSDTYEIIEGIYDFESDLIFYNSNDRYTYLFFLGNNSVDGVSSAWTIDSHNASAVNVNGVNIFVFDNNIYFNVSFKDENNFDVEANDAFNTKRLTVYTSDLTYSFVYASGSMHLADKYVGTYSYDSKTISFDGYKTVKIDSDYGTYEIIDDIVYITISNKYYRVSFNEGTCTLNEEKVTITYMNNNSILGSFEIYKNIPTELSDFVVEGFVLIDWYFDKNLTNKVYLKDGKYTPTSSITLYGLYAESVIINIVDEYSSINMIVVGDGEEISTKLPDHQTNIYSPDGSHYFTGWYLDQEYTITLPEAACVSVSDSGVTIYAKWDVVISYVGTYTGNEMASKGFNSTLKKTLTIDVNGNISGLISGRVVNYNGNTQELKYQENGSSVIKTFFLNASIGVIAGIYNNGMIDTDFYYLSKYQEITPEANRIGLYAPKEPGSNYIGYYLYIISTTIDSKGTTKLITLYNNHIYDNVCYETSSNVTLNTLDQIKGTNTLIIKNLDDNSRLIGVYAENSAIYDASSSKYVHPLDNYLGYYTNGADSIYLDGAGKVLFDNKEGIYSLSSNSSYTFDVYVVSDNVNVEFYELTISGTNYQMNKPAINASFTSSQTQVADKLWNKNIVYTLPVLENTNTHVFRGWFIDDVEYLTYEPLDTNDVTFTALWKEKVIVTIDDTNESSIKTFEYGMGEIFEYDKPIYEGYKFTGYYDENNVLVLNGSTLTASINLHATWVEAPIYNMSYNFAFIKAERDSEESTGNFYVDDRIPIVNVNADGFAANPATYPFTNLNIQITEDSTYLETGKITFTTTNINTLESEVYTGYVDLETGLIIVIVDSANLYFLSPYTRLSSSTLFGSYWDNLAVICGTHKYDGNTVNFIVDNGVVTFGVSFIDNNGNSITGKECLKQKAVDISKAGNVLVTFGYYNNSMVRENDSKGSYTNDTNTLVLNGISTATLNGEKGTYTSKKITNGYNIYLTINNVYYTTSINTTTHALEQVVKPMINVTMNADGGTLEDNITSLNTNIKVTLPTPTKDGFVFRGWYINGSQAAVYSVTPTKDMTMIAKWVKEVKLTVNYETVSDHTFGLGTVIYSFGEGETISFDYPKTLVDGYLLTGWIKGVEEYTLGQINSSFTIKAIWQVASPFYGTWNGVEVFGSSTGVTQYVNTGYVLNFNVDGVTSSTSRLAYSSISYNESHQLYQMGSNVCAYDLNYGVLVVNDRGYSYTSKGFNDEEEIYRYQELGYDCYVFFKGRVATTDKNGCCFNGGYTRILDFEFEDETKMTILIYNNSVYCNVRLETTDEMELTAKNAYAASNLTVYDDTNQVIVSFENVDGELQVVSE